MEQYTTLIIAFIGGGTLPLIVSALFNRRKSTSDLNIDRDGEILKWLDKALHAADELITVKYKLHSATMELEKCHARVKQCKCSDDVSEEKH